MAGQPFCASLCSQTSMVLPAPFVLSRPLPPPGLAPLPEFVFLSDDLLELHAEAVTATATASTPSATILRLTLASSIGLDQSRDWHGQLALSIGRRVDAAVVTGPSRARPAGWRGRRHARSPRPAPTRRPGAGLLLACSSRRRPAPLGPRRVRMRRFRRQCPPPVHATWRWPGRRRS